jgi:carotenoid cleavage dioxygenase
MDYNQTVRFIVLPRFAKSQAEAIDIELPTPGQGFHFMNAYEVDAQTINLWGCLARKFSMDFGKSEAETLPNVLYRWTLNLKTKQVTETAVYDANDIEFVRTNDDMFGYKTKFGYGSLLDMGDGPRGVAQVKIDLDSSKVVGQIDFGEKRRAGEVVFAPKTNATAEDDGYLMGFVYDEAQGTSELSIYDAKTMAQKPVARVLIPQRVPFGFHALWVHDHQLKAQK